MRRAGIIPWCAVAFFIALSCSDSPSGPAVNWGTPAGMPDWYSGEYDWIDSAYEKCASVAFFEPRTIIRVGGVSPDGTTILGVHEHQKPFLYDIQERRVTKRIGQDKDNFIDARWSSDGTMIVGSYLQPIIGKAYVPYLYLLHTDQGQILPLPDTLEPIGQFMSFSMKDNALLLYKVVDRTIVPPFYLYSLSSHTPTPSLIPDAIGNIAVVSERERLWFRRNYISPDFSESVDLRVAPLSEPEAIATFGLPDVLRVGRAELSRDGNWLSAPMTVRLPDDRFLSASRCMGLGIIDLRPGSPYRYQIYAFYPDHTNASKLCVNSYTLPGSAWSPDNRYVYHEQIRLSDTTVQIVRREVATGKVEVLSNFKGAP